jgi:hypothetical protein
MTENLKKRPSHRCFKCARVTENLLDYVAVSGFVSSEHICRECLMKMVAEANGRICKVDADTWIFLPKDEPDHTKAMMLKYHDRDYKATPPANWELWAKHWLG